MTMQHNIDIVGRNFGRNMDQPKLQPLAPKIDLQRPVLIPIAIPAHHCERRTDRFQIERDRRLANIAQMPDLIRLARKIDNLLRQFVMRVGQNKNLHSANSRTTNTTGPKVATFIFVVTLVAFVRALTPNNVI